jgi:YggT family protein
LRVVFTPQQYAEESEEVTSMVYTIRNIIVTFLNILLGVGAFFLGLRIVLRLFSANPATPFVSWIYNVSERFMSPFHGIFPDIPIAGGVVFDVVALLTLLAYTLITYLVIGLIDAAFTSRWGSDVIEERHVTHVS